MRWMMEIDELITKRKKLNAQWIAKLFDGFSLYFVSKKLKKLKLLQLINK